jgi:hypothetical protein
MTAEPEKIQVAVSDLVRRHLPKGIESVSVEPAEDKDGDEYLLVTVRLATTDIDDEALERLLEDIESEVAGLDERYPSVRFLDAA